MSNLTPNIKQLPTVRVEKWAQAFMCGLCVLPMLFSVWALVHKIQAQGNDLHIAIPVFIMMFAVFSWFLARFYHLCSIELNAEGVSQSYVLFQKQLGVRVHLRWSQIQRVSFSEFSYLFIGEDGSKIELNTSLFGNAKNTIERVRELLPKNLLAQLEK